LYYRFEETPLFVPPVYFTEPIQLFEEESGIFIHHALFDSASSQISYVIESDNISNELRFADHSAVPFIHATEGVHWLPAFTQTPAETRFDNHNIVLGKLNFSPVRSLDSIIELTFTDVFYRYPLPFREIDLRALFSRRPEQQRIPAGKYQLVLEGMALQGNVVVLVLHGLDEDGRRLETRVDATLAVETETGRVVVDGECRSINIGADVLFDITEVREQLVGIPVAQYRVIIHAAEFRVPRVTVSLDLNEIHDIQGQRLTSATGLVREAFMTRLAYKAYRMTRDEIRGFSEEVLADRALMRRYNPAGSPELPRYGMNIVSGKITENGRYIALVEEEWIAGRGEEISYMYNLHQVEAEWGLGGWVIVSNVVLE
jgi:hypothetical protein